MIYDLNISKRLLSTKASSASRLLNTWLRSFCFTSMSSKISFPSSVLLTSTSLLSEQFKLFITRCLATNLTTNLGVSLIRSGSLSLIWQVLRCLPAPRRIRSKLYCFGVICHIARYSLDFSISQLGVSKKNYHRFLVRAVR